MSEEEQKVAEFEEIIDVETFKIVGVSKSILYEEAVHSIGEFWLDEQKYGTISTLLKLADGEHRGVFGINTNMGEKIFDYIIGVSSIVERHEFVSITIPTGKFAVFACDYKNLLNVYNYIFKEWLPNSNYKKCAGDLVEKYFDGKNCKVYIPVMEK